MKRLFKSRFQFSKGNLIRADVYRISYNTKKHNWEYILIRSYTIKTVWVLVFSVIYKLESRQLIQPLRLFCFAIGDSSSQLKSQNCINDIMYWCQSLTVLYITNLLFFQIRPLLAWIFRILQIIKTFVIKRQTCFIFTKRLFDSRFSFQSDI